MRVSVEKEGYQKQEYCVFTTEGSFNLDVELEPVIPLISKSKNYYNRLPLALGGTVLLALLVGSMIKWLLLCPPVPRIISFSLDSNSIYMGESAMLHWDTKNASTVKIEPGIGKVKPQGDIKVKPARTMEYTLTAMNKGKKIVSKTLIIEVLDKKNAIALVSFDVKPYEDALKGFENTCNCNVERIIISNSKKLNILNEIEGKDPDLLLAIGIDALSKIIKIKDIPIIYLMIPNPQSILSGEENITGVSMNISPEKQLDIFKKALPNIKKIGLLFDPNNSGFFVKRARGEAGNKGIDLIIKEVHSPKTVPPSLIDMKEEIDAIWMLPEITVFSPEMIEFLFIFAFENKIPVFTFSKRFLEMGALISLSTEPFDLGKQGGEMAKRVMYKNKIRNLSGDEARKVIISINSKMAKKLGITISDEILKRVE